MTVPQDLLDILVCPKCRGELRREEAPERLVCDVCRVAYPVVDDVPHMLIDEARPLDGTPGR